MGNGLKLLAMIFLGFLLLEIGLTGALGSMLAAFVVPGYLGLYSASAPYDVAASRAAASARLAPLLAASVALGTLTQQQASAVLAAVAQSTPGTPNLDRAIAQALADALMTGQVSASDANAILNAKG